VRIEKKNLFYFGLMFQMADDILPAVGVRRSRNQVDFKRRCHAEAGKKWGRPPPAALLLLKAKPAMPDYAACTGRF